MSETEQFLHWGVCPQSGHSMREAYPLLLWSSIVPCLLLMFCSMSSMSWFANAFVVRFFFRSSVIESMLIAGSCALSVRFVISSRWYFPICALK